MNGDYKMSNQGDVLHPIECKCFTWKPIIAGALIAIGLTFLLNLFSVAISLTAFTTNDQGVENIALGGLIATALGIVVSMFASGWLAGYLGNRYCTKRHLGALYGFLTWCLALIITIFLAVHIQDYIKFYTHFISGTTVSLSNARMGAQLSIPAHQATQIVISTYIVFSLFFLSAFACSLGGHCGMRYVCKNECATKI
jgi:hypothetical protein